MVLAKSDPISSAVTGEKAERAGVQMHGGNSRRVWLYPETESRSSAKTGERWRCLLEVEERRGRTLRCFRKEGDRWKRELML